MKCKKFNFKGASILVLQEGEMVEFYMNYKTSDYFFCVGYKAKIEDITECDAISIWNQYFDCTVEEENALISYHEAMMEELEKRQESKKKRKK
jgi:hypothetical protein